MRSKLKDKWLVAMAKEMQALETTGSAKSRASPRKWVYKTNMCAEGTIERLKAPAAMNRSSGPTFFAVSEA
ncbi:hypothetical protein PR002_g1402 [Phytophthora rubi]|uniref:Uncharacterized protein n=1 Tax=Phytophthora rubi TaxID=129364 RepID=A0A6A3NQQ4_9STRA|nr:hypothetical protein PR002_g1402 [Phytophthora rubi]